MTGALDFFTAISNGLHSIGVDYVDTDVLPDEKNIYSFVTFTVREAPGTVHYLSGLVPPRGVILDPITGRYRSEDGKLGTLVSKPLNEVQLVTPTAPFVLSYLGTPTATIAQTADPGAVQAALELIPALTGNVYVYRVAVNERQKISFSGAPSGGAFTLADGGPSTVAISRNANSGSVQQALQQLPSIGPEGCSVIGPVGGPWEVENTGARAGIDVALLTANSAGLTPSGSVVITTLVPGSSTAPHKVNFIGALQGTDVAALTGTGCTISTATQGNPVEGVALVANTPILELGQDAEGNDIPLIYDVTFLVPSLEVGKKGRFIGGFAFEAPKVGGGTIDFASVPKLLLKPGLR
jgi:hypothetical protein